MQPPIALVETPVADTLGEVTEKTTKAKEPGPNAASKESIDRLRRRIEDGLKLKFTDGIQEAGLSHATAFRMVKYDASVGSVKRVDEWVRKREIDLGIRSSDQQARMVDEWAELGAELSRLDPADFEERLAALHDYVRAKKMLSEASKRLGRLFAA